jgi:hypothetical protein
MDGCRRVRRRDSDRHLAPESRERVEPLGEPAVDRSEKLACFIPLALVAQEPRHAHRRAQFPGFCLLLASNRERSLEIRFRICVIPVPSASRRMSLRGIKDGTGSELELARHFSQIMALDILTGQWDRWSGGNVEATTDGSRVYFLACDNGGASMTGPGTFAKYSRIVTRFDRAQIQRVERVVQLLGGHDQSAELVAALHLSSDPRFLLNRAQTLLAFVRTQASQHGDATYFAAR